MDRANINRNNLKRNFLKEIIMRLDFQGVLQAEMEGILLEVKPYLKSKGFNRYAEKVNNQVIDDGDGIKDLKAQIIYSFIAESLGYTLELSNSCIIISIKTQGYSSFDVYSDIFRNIINIFNRKIDFFTGIRFGFRKINFCFAKSKDVISKYFSTEYYNCAIPISGIETQLIKRQDCLTNGAQNFSLCHSIEAGMLDEQLMYKITLDTDIYTEQQNEIERILFEENNLSVMNEAMFRIYLSAITDDMIDLLTRDDDLEVDEIIGVENNE